MILERVALPREPATPRRARHYLEPRLLSLGMPPEDTDELLVAVGEAVTNAVVHGGGDERQDGITIELIARGDRVAVAVTSARGHWPVPQATLPVDPGAIGGRGLFVMRYLTDSIRIQQTPRGTTVYLTRRVRANRERPGGKPPPYPAPMLHGPRRTA